MAKFTPRKPEKEVISLRLAISTLEEIDQKAAEIGISRNELINQMIMYALNVVQRTLWNLKLLNHMLKKMV